MKQRLLILRHGKSDWSRPVDDFHRPLKKRGRKNASRMGRWLAEQGMVPEYIVSSPAVRAVQTARLACGAMGISPERIRLEEAVYEADEQQLLKVLQGVPKKTASVLLVGHNFGLEDLVVYLARGRVPWPEDNKLLPTAAVAIFTVQAVWKELGPNTVTLERLQRPRLLD